MKVQVNCHPAVCPAVAQCGVAPISQGGAGICGLRRAKARRYKTDIGVYDPSTPLLLRAAGVQAVLCRHDVKRNSDTLTRKARPNGAAERVRLKVKKIIGCSQVPKPYCVHALANHISEVLKN